MKLKSIKIEKTILSVLILLASCTEPQVHQQQKDIPVIKDTAQPYNAEQITTPQHLGVTVLNDTSANIHFENITEADFIKYKASYAVQIDTTFSKINSKEDALAFNIKTADNLYRFKGKKDYSMRYYYKGFIKPLKLYLIDNIDNNNELDWLIGIDSLTNVKYFFESPFDVGVDKVLVSPGGNYLLCTVTNGYEAKMSMLYLLKIHKKGNVFSYTNFLGYNSISWQIDDAVWIDENNFALKVYDRKYNDWDNFKDGRDVTENIRYLKGRFE